MKSINYDDGISTDIHFSIDLVTMLDVETKVIKLKDELDTLIVNLNDIRYIE